MSGTPYDDASHPRASLRGKGWEILYGTSPPDADVPARDEAEQAVPPPAQVEDEAAQDLIAAPERAKLLGGSPAAPDDLEEAVPLEDEFPPVQPGSAGGEETEAFPQFEAAIVENFVMAEAYRLRPEIEALTPVMPEVLPEPEEAVSEESPAGEQPPAVEEEANGLVLEPGEDEELAFFEAAARNGNGNGNGNGNDAGGLAARVEDVGQLEPVSTVIRPQDVRIDSGRLTPVSSRPSADELFAEAQEVVPDASLLEKLVTDEEIEKAWNEIETLQGQIVQSVEGDRRLTDIYQKELLEASTLLLQSRANYDDVRAIIYRVRTDLARDAKIRRDIATYKPRIIRYLLLMLILWVLLMAAQPWFWQFMSGVVGMEILGLLYHPTLFGMLGAIINAYFTLNKHAIQLRDFDPAHVSWYLMNPVIGLVMGLLMTLVFGAGIVSTLSAGIFSDPEMLGQYPFLLWVLCFLAGYNQNVVLRLLDRTFSFLRGMENDREGEREQPSAPSVPAG